ncbi:hypothetical protein [Colwellia hornerae]|uniref:HD-GYP domain-containing protein n=1 Tax=Colwellia hornerae TaxID=89402 RepID=A0A5C6Q7U1_9GAMM|nr:hypothetical protein [Colwellia hornerae]TWX52232.1 hypothetical protein ESZ28_13440 [Colwellia hornerae]TWX57581.1 hypothetical protein ESZ26_13405 [Colwellia hornerae]TWX64933.1 hypothetical protein ESZ27_13720 [Colwellia hornerae]
MNIINQLVKETSKQFSTNILNSGMEYGINKDITDPQGKRVFLKAGTEITDKIREKLTSLQKEGIIGHEDVIALTEDKTTEDLLAPILDLAKSNPVLNNFQLTATLTTIADYIKSGSIPKKIIDHLSIFSHINPSAYQNTLINLVFGTHIGKANNYSPTELSELISVLFFENIGYARLNSTMKDARLVHPILSKEITRIAGLENKLVLESIEQHEEKLDGSGYPKKLTQIHEYAQISQIANQYSQITRKSKNINTAIGELYLLGEGFDFRTSQKTSSIYSYHLQRPLLAIMQESIQTNTHQQAYGNHLYDQLSKVIKWANTLNASNPEMNFIQAKLRSALWVSETSQQPFQIDREELKDNQICTMFINDARKLVLQISQFANYFNQVLHYPIKIDNISTNKEYFLKLINPII